MPARRVTLVQIATRLPKSEAAALERLARSNERSVAQELRALIRGHLATNGGAK